MPLISFARSRASLAIVTCLACAVSPTLSAEDAPPGAEHRAEHGAEQPKGRLLLMGGAERDDNPVVWNELLALAGGTGARVAVFPTGGQHPEETGAALAARLRRLGLDPFVVPVGVARDYPDYRQVVADPAWVDRVRRADAVFLSPGMQSRYRRSLIDEQGRDTPMLAAIRHVHRRGGLVAGTSAGTAVMSRVMFVDADFVLPTMLNGTRLGRGLDAGFGLVPAEWFVDQHFLARGRFARALVAMQSQNFSFGLGVDEDTAVVIEQGRTARVVGYRGAVILDLSQAAHDRSLGRFNLRNARLTYLSHGDRIDLATRAVTVDPEKRPQDLVDPRKPGFEPYFSHRIFSNDILGNMALLDLMYKLVDSPYDEAIGLAYDGLTARRGDAPGFEFRFYRGEDTVSWNSHRAHGDSHTVKNVYLDIRPITIHGPLYE